MAECGNWSTYIGITGGQKPHFGPVKAEGSLYVAKRGIEDCQNVLTPAKHASNRMFTNGLLQTLNLLQKGLGMTFRPNTVKFFRATTGREP